MFCFQKRRQKGARLFAFQREVIVLCNQVCCFLKPHANGHNIVGQQPATLLGPTCCVHLHGTTTMLVLLGTCCLQFETGQTFRPMQTDPTLLVNITQHCWAQHVASVCMEPQQCWYFLALVASSLKPVKLLGPCKRTQLCWPTTRNNVVTCCVRLHGP